MLYDMHHMEGVGEMPIAFPCRCLDMHPVRGQLEWRRKNAAGMRCMLLIVIWLNSDPKRLKRLRGDNG